ncbi:MAG: hypothetical protein GC162_08265 [Planctomycetes bacterium]|nr:hypothetical protein [Planctomycetota bacterium]
MRMDKIARQFVMCALMMTLWATGARAALTGYWTLDDLTTGVTNAGTDGATSDLSVGGNPVATTGFIGSGAIAFDGTGDMLSTNTASNAADDLAAYGFTLSGWFKVAAAPANRYTVFGVSNLASGSLYYGGGVFSNGTNYLMTRNPTFDAAPFDTDGPNVADNQWHQLTGVYTSNTLVQMYVDGKLVSTDTAAQTFSSAVDTLSIGGIRRSNANASTPTDPMIGSIDDVGLFNTSLKAADVALVNGLGRTASAGLDQLAPAQALFSGRIGSTATVAGATWKKVSSLSGVTGDYSGTSAGGDAKITLNNSGFGIERASVGNVFVEDPFAYSPGALNTKNAEWAATSGGGFTVENHGLNHPNLLNESGLDATAKNARSTIDLNHTFGNADETVFLSFLMQTSSNSQNNDAAGSFFTIELYDGATRKYAVGLLRGDGNTASAQFEQRAYDLSNTATPDLGVFTSDVALIVVKFVFSNLGDALTIDAWLNPNGETDFNAVSNRISIASGAFNFDKLAMAAAATAAPGATGVTFDEIRVAGSAPLVTTIPAPAALPAGLALMSLLWIRRR